MLPHFTGSKLSAGTVFSQSWTSDKGLDLQRTLNISSYFPALLVYFQFFSYWNHHDSFWKCIFIFTWVLIKIIMPRESWRQSSPWKVKKLITKLLTCRQIFRHDHMTGCSGSRWQKSIPHYGQLSIFITNLLFSSWYTKHVMIDYQPPWVAVLPRNEILSTQ